MFADLDSGERTGPAAAPPTAAGPVLPATRRASVHRRGRDGDLNLRPGGEPVARFQEHDVERADDDPVAVLDLLVDRDLADPEVEHGVRGGVEGDGLAADHELD